MKIKDKYIYNLLIMIITLFSIEMLFKVLNNFNIISYSTIRILISVSIISIIFVYIFNLFKNRRVRNILSIIFVLIYTAYTFMQLGFINFLGVYISFHTSSQFGAVTNYIVDFLSSFKLTYYLIFIPLILYIVYYILLRKKKYYRVKPAKRNLILVVIVIILSLLYSFTLRAKFMQNKFQTKKTVDLFYNPSVPTIAVHELGPVIFGISDFKTFIFPVDEEIIPSNNNTEPIEKPTRDVLPVLSELASSDENKKYSYLNNFYANQKVTDYNDYTGMFKGKNVVVILMESVNEGIINEKYFPNFYNLYSNGWHWVNHYSPRNSCATGNNEFSAMTSLFSIYNTCTSNVYKENTYFESMFGVFKDSGYNTVSMHDFTEWYYKRNTIHSNMRSDKYLDIDDLNMSIKGVYGEWPSDVEFFTKAFDYITNREDKSTPYLAWLTTVTSHQPYITSSELGDLHKDYFMSEGYSKPVSRYFSKLKVLDDAIGVMMDKLTESGELDNTVIVLLADHYPYGLKNDYLSEFINHDLDDYEREKTPFVIYNSSMQNKEFDSYTSYINLLPTVANLMGVEYDPRLYMGTDLFSEDYTSRVVFADGSWKNEIAYYDASTSKITYFTDKEYTVEEVQKINELVTMKISVSTSSIKLNYFNYLGKKIDEYKSSLNNEETTGLEENE